MRCLGQKVTNMAGAMNALFFGCKRASFRTPISGQGVYLRRLAECTAMGPKTQTTENEDGKDSEPPAGFTGLLGKGSKKKGVSKTAKAGLLLPVSKVNRHLRSSKKSQRVGGGAPVYLTAVLEYAIAEIFEAAMAQLGKRKRITPTDLLKGIRGDKELNQLLGGVSVFVGDKVKDITGAVTFKA